MRRTKVWFLRATSLFVALAIGFGLAEGIARLCVDAPGPAPRGDGEIMRESAEASRGWELVPHTRMQLFYPARNGEERVVTHDVGPHGWRGARFTTRKRPGSVRIGCVGDSHTFGWGVEESETWPVQLERVLRERGYDVEVLNFGVPNTNLEEKAFIVEHIALQADCDLIALQLHFDDNALDGINLGRRAGHAWVASAQREGPSDTLEWLRERFVSVELVTEGLRRQRASQAYVMRHTAAMRSGHPAAVRIDQSLKNLRAATHERGAALAAFIYPLPVRTENGWASAKLDEQWMDAARRAGIDALTFDRAFDRVSGDVCVHPLDPHVNARAQSECAQAAANFLVERGLLSEERVHEWSHERHLVHEDQHEQDR